MSWTDENHHLILTTLSAKAALVLSQLIRRVAKCRKEQETAFWEITLGRLQAGVAPILKFPTTGLLGTLPSLEVSVSSDIVHSWK
jgi:hypothetical protein